MMAKTIIGLFIFNILFPVFVFQFGFGPLNFLLVSAASLVSAINYFIVKDFKFHIDLVKLLQPFYICFLTVIISFECEIELSVLFVSAILWALSVYLVSSEVNRSNLIFKRFGLYLSMIPIVVAITSNLLFSSMPIWFNKRTIIFILYASLVLTHFLVGMPVRKGVFATSDAKSYTQLKFSTVLFLVCKTLLFLGYYNYNHVFQVIYIAIIIVMLLSLRQNKDLFLSAVILFLASRFIPGDISYTLFDPGLTAIIVMLFYVKTPELFRKETPFGNLRVIYSVLKKKKVFLHDNTLHGVEDEDYDGGLFKHQYYTGVDKKSQFLRVFEKLEPKYKDIAVVGMGVGMLAALVSKRQKLTFFEINPVMEDIAIHSGLFNYIKYSKGAVDVTIGHGRERLENSGKKFDMLILDAYRGSDVVQEFITEEAMSLYFKKILNNKALIFIHLTSGTSNSKGSIAAVCRKLKLHAKISFQSSDDSDEDDIFTRCYSDGVYKKFTSKIVDFILKNVKNYSGSLFATSRYSDVKWAIVSDNKKLLDDVTEGGNWVDLLSRYKGKVIVDRDVGYSSKTPITDEVS